MELKAFLAEEQAIIEAALERLTPDRTVPPARLHEAMRYSLLNGGKRLRPILTRQGAAACGGDPRRALPVACAYECIHSYSLIHDDLPAMDDDDLRRGRPTSHKVYGEALAILAGDGLLTLAFELIATAAYRPPVATRLVMDLARAAGSVGMVGGQVLDMETEAAVQQAGAGPLPFDGTERLPAIHRWKTGALITGAVVAGGVVAGGSAEQVAALNRYGQALGLAFQIVDDILDVVGDTSELGKPQGSDQARGKLTYPALYGLDEARRMATAQVAAAMEALTGFDEGARWLKELARYVLDRTH